MTRMGNHDNRFDDAMFEKISRTRVRRLLERELCSLQQIEQQFVKRCFVQNSNRTVAAGSTTTATDERNMTRKTRSRQFRIHTTYNNLVDHKRHTKLIGDHADFISLKAFDDTATFLALDGLDAIDVSGKFQYVNFPNKMPRTRTASAVLDKKDSSPMSPVESDSGHHLRSRKNINYMTPPLDDDNSLGEKPELPKEFRELRSSSRLLAKLTEQIGDSDEVWNSGRPKRSCNRRRVSSDERLIADNRNYYKVEVLATKLRSTTHIAENEVVDDKGKAKKRSSELIRLHNEAESFLFPKKDESSEEDDHHEQHLDVKVEDDESMHSTSSESRCKKRRRTHAEVFISDNEKYYKFETPGSRLRYQGSYLSPVSWKNRNNGDLHSDKTDKSAIDCDDSNDSDFKLNLDEYNFSFEHIPKEQAWYQTFQRKDEGEEKYVFVNDENFCDSLVLPYQLDYVPPLNPRSCISQYKQIRKCLMEPPSASASSVGCSTPDPNASNSSTDPPCNHEDEDSKISANTEVSSASGGDETNAVVSRKRAKKCFQSDNGKNPRKSPRQHASTLAILSSLIHQRKRRSKRTANLPTIVEEANTRKSTQKQPKIDYYSMAQNFDEEFANVCCDDLPDDFDDGIDFNRCQLDVTDLLESYDTCRTPVVNRSLIKRFVTGKPGRKPGRKKKNRTGWPNRNKRKRDRILKDDDSTIDSSGSDVCVMKKRKLAVNNNKSDRISDFGLSDRLLTNGDESLTSKLNKSDEFNVDIHYQPYVKVQKLDNKNRVDSTNAPTPKDGNNKRSRSPKRTNRGQRRMPASPKSPRMLRRPRGRWYRER